MKFELVEFPEPESPDAGDDPVAAINAAAGRLVTEARAEGERIDASLAELAAVVSRRAPAGAAGTDLRPPGNFRADRFTGREHDR
jgi:hypothetical protein